MATVIDDFTSGTYGVTIEKGNDLNHQAGSMLGGGRFTQLAVALNPQNQPAHIDITDGCLNLSVGAMQSVRLELGYPFQMDSGDGKQGHHLSFVDLGCGDFRSMGSAFRTKFRSGINVTVNFNIVVHTATGIGQYGENFNLSIGETNNIDFPFEKFVGNSPLDFSKVAVVVFIFQTWGDFVVDSFEIS